MNFGEAIEYIKNGKKVSRKSWNDKNQYIFLIEAKDLFGVITKYVEGTVLISNVLALKTGSNQVHLGWVGRNDMLYDDWYVVEEE